MTLSPVFSPLDWGRLAYLGVPIAADAECHHHRTIDELAREVIKCCLNASESIEVVERHRRAIEAWIWALASEYPTVFRERIDCVLVQGFLPKDPDGQHIKLRRISAGILSQYL